MSEKIQDKSAEYSAEQVEQLSDAASEQVERLEKKLDNAAERAPTEDTEKLKENAEKIAEKQEKRSEKKASPAEKRKDTPLPNKKAKKAAFNATMKEARGHMSTPSRTFSKFIHAAPIEKTSEFVGATVARPNALLAGSVSAFALTLLVYVVARYYGYPLTGSESIAAFILGWLLGILFDYFRVMITGKKAG